MLSRHGICRPSQNDINEMDLLRAFAQDAIELLKRFPEPDTFLGRKTQEAFPKGTQEN
jgi:hypothetical protein